MNGRSNREPGFGNQLAANFKGLEQLGKLLGRAPSRAGYRVDYLAQLVQSSCKIFANTWALESESIAAIVRSTGFKIVLGIFLTVIVGVIVLWFVSNFLTLAVR